MKKAVILGMLFLGVMAVSAPAFAVNQPSFFMDMVTGEGSTAHADAYTLGQTPWLYVSSSNPSYMKLEASYWKNPSSGAVTWADSLMFGSQLWVSADTWSDLSSKEKIGTWTVDAHLNSLKTNGQLGPVIGGGSTTFNVVAPEPISAVLFLLGGAGLVTRKLVSNRKKV